MKDPVMNTLRDCRLGFTLIDKYVRTTLNNPKLADELGAKLYIDKINSLLSKMEIKS